MSQAPDPRPAPKGRILGGMLLLAGAAMLLAVLAADIGGTPTLEAWAYTLGLAFGPMLQATGLALFLIGGWILWRSGRREDDG